jgi:predicted phosphodiesterase
MMYRGIFSSVSYTRTDTAMTLHLIPSSRRQFLKTTITAGIATLACRPATAAPTVAPNRWALLADTHMAGDEKTVARGANMFDNLNAVISEVLTEDPLPAGVIINGDCAYLKGLDSDYQTLRRPIDRLLDAGVPVHMTMGNHDDRGPFYAAFAKQKPENEFVAGKHVAVLQCQDANLFLVDSLQLVNKVTGELGESQLQWLADTLQAHSDKPALIIGHHNPQYLPAGSTAQVSGLADTAAFVDVMHSQPHVQAYIYGHTHDWKLSKTAGRVHLINQPPCAYVFNESRPNGWVRMIVGKDEFSVELRALEESHPQHGEKHVLSHRIATVK